MRLERYFTYGGYMRRCKGLNLLRIPFSGYKQWWGYLIVRKGGKPFSPKYRRWCQHIWDKTGKPWMASREMNTCLICGKYAPGPD